MGNDGGRPRLIVVTGRPGSGKTTLAHALGRELYMPVVSRDELKEGYVHTLGRGHADLPEDTNGVVTRAFFDLLAQYLARDISVIAEAAFQHELWLRGLEPLAARLALVLCEVDGQTALDRFLARGMRDERRLYFHGDRGVAMAKAGRAPTVGEYRAPRLDAPTFRVDTRGAYDPPLAELARRILAS